MAVDEEFTARSAAEDSIPTGSGSAPAQGVDAGGRANPCGGASRAARASTVQPRKRRFRSKSVAPLSIRWEVQQAGLPAVERERMREVLGKKRRRDRPGTGQQSQTQQDNSTPQQQTAAAPAAAAREESQAPPKPKSHHKRGDALVAPLPLTWERVERRVNASSAVSCYGVRKRLPKSLVEAATKNTSGRGRKIELRETPRVKAFNDEFAKKFDYRRDIMTRHPTTGARGPCAPNARARLCLCCMKRFSASRMTWAWQY